MNAPLPLEPACWSWEVPTLPMPNTTGRIVTWQANRCAICAVHRPRTTRYPQRSDGLVEDHDHDTGLIRGYLCVRCNTGEGRDRHPVFAAYRSRPPAVILGIRRWRHAGTDWDTRNAEMAWEHALRELQDRAKGRGAIAECLRLERAAQARGETLPDYCYPKVELLALAAAAERVGFTAEEWWGEREHLAFRWRFRRGMDAIWRDEYLASLREWVHERRFGRLAA